MAAISTNPVQIAAGTKVTNTGTSRIYFDTSSNPSRSRHIGHIEPGASYTATDPIYIVAFDGDSTYTIGGSSAGRQAPFGISSLEVVGHSIAAGASASSLDDFGYGGKLKRLLGASRFRTLAVGGAVACWPTAGSVGDGGATQVLQQMLRPGSPGFPAPAAPYLPTSQIVVEHFGLNDLAVLGSQNPLPLQTARRTILSRICAAAIWEEDNAAWAKTGTWAGLNLAYVGSGPQVSYTATPGDKATFNLPADYPGGLTIGIGIFVNAQNAPSTYGIKIDGASQPDLTLNPALFCDQSAAGKHLIYTHRIPGLSPGAHTIEVSLKSGPILALDFAQVEADPLDGPLIITVLPHKPINYTLWQNWPHGAGAGTDPMTDASVDASKDSMRVVNQEFGQRVIEIELDPILNKDPALHVSDVTHPNDKGHALIADYIANVVASSNLLTDRIRTRPIPRRLAWYRPPVKMGGPAFATGWSQFGSSQKPEFGWFRDDQGKVTLRGAVKAAAGAGPTITTLPPAYGLRPIQDVEFEVSYYTGAAFVAASLKIGADGTIQLESPAVSTTAGNFLNVNVSWDGEL